ncbi:MAG: xylan 1,4-beta-xylosidase [Oscillospiraceae bacterium]|nr:xylan 1,4-beta-xylosidase [Oscillospiraceae bacterium]
MREKRFVVHSENIGLKQVTILMDKLTGVHYLFYAECNAGGLTPLLGSDGKPVIEKLPSDEEEEASDGD